jgi:hypothetical protein
MKDLLIILVGTVVLGAIGFFGPMFVMDQLHSREIDQLSKDSNLDMKRIEDATRKAFQDADNTLTYSTVGGGIGVAVGLVGSFALVKYFERRKKERVPTQAQPS